MINKGLLKRKAQLKDLEYWLSTREDYRMQINFYVPQTPDHCCITISGCRKGEVSDLVLDCIRTQIASIEQHENNQ